MSAFAVLDKAISRDGGSAAALVKLVAQEELQRGSGNGPDQARPDVGHFNVVPFSDLAQMRPKPITYWWSGYMPAGVVTLLSAHGGIGKSTVALMLAVSMALGRPLFGIPTRQGRVAFFSGEDGEELLRLRLHGICQQLGVRVGELDGKLHILDATRHDPTLFSEGNAGGRRTGQTTPSFMALTAYIAQREIDVLIVDNASDTFDANEIDRAAVRGFMRALAGIAQDRGGAVLLLAHIDKSSARGARGPHSEGYSGSTAWHNSARSRLYMSKDKDGFLLLEHQKHNLGPLHQPLRLRWPEGGTPQVDEPMTPLVNGIADHGHSKALLKLIAEFTARGEFITTATTSRTHAAKLMHREPTYPKLKDVEVFDLLRCAERDGQLERICFKGTDRHQRERWQVTAAGAAFAGIVAGTAATAATSVVTAPDAPAAGAAGTAATSLPGGVGETAPHDVTPARVGDGSIREGPN